MPDLQLPPAPVPPSLNLPPTDPAPWAVARDEMAQSSEVGDLPVSPTSIPTVEFSASPTSIPTDDGSLVPLAAEYSGGRCKIWTHQFEKLIFTPGEL